ncbi:MAG: hypothetical protein K2H20_04480, partial [Bacilli bacterium]|nr:hypothetical protein [Bacilli bacterium]
MFNDNKINTIISRFHTDTNTPKNDLDVKTKYGLSHGRNLLTKQAEDNNTYKSNGYDNPYCRVWTHHHQYDRLDKLIRPFVTKDENGESKPVGLMDFHNWQNFKMVNRESETGNGDNENANDWGWKYNNDAWKYSVLQDNGFVNITPKYVNGGATNIHTKQCMFSIENLAWRDFDPYSFEKALSWEQRGPMGGRIMWFPPYGISFNETTQTNWNGSTFIGRGEDVYTYINTKRSGTLNFMLVVDHPSINDYVSFYEANHVNVHDTDLLRFQAGCDVLKSGSTETPTNSDSNNENDSNNSNKQSSYEGMLNHAQPTPLTDEYIEKVKSVKENVEKKEKPQEPESTPDDVITITFFVFYPNNYSGVYDRMNDSNVDPIAYLLFGKGAQVKSQQDKISVSSNISFKDLSNSGNGYEMNVGEKKGISINDNENYLIGSEIKLYGGKDGKEVIGTVRRKWYYRIDCTYKNSNFNGTDNP